MQFLGYVGILGIVFYFCHIIVGKVLYRGYSSKRQAISDLTAVGATSRLYATIFTALYGMCMLAFLTGFYLFFHAEFNMVFAVGTIFLIIMQIVSSAGYLAFPLSGSKVTSKLQDKMHIVVTALVVVSSIVALIFITIGSFMSGIIWLGVASIVTFLLMMLGAIITGKRPQILGIGERITIYSLHVYLFALAVMLLTWV